jgi:hypothetical protein
VNLYDRSWIAKLITTIYKNLDKGHPVSLKNKDTGEKGGAAQPPINLGKRSQKRRKEDRPRTREQELWGVSVEDIDRSIAGDTLEDVLKGQKKYDSRKRHRRK